MSRLTQIALATFVAIGAAFSITGAAQATDRVAAQCDDNGVLERIVGKFRYQVTHVPHLADVEIIDFRKVHQQRYIPFSEKRPIARRYCGATAHLSDGRKRTIWYLIEDGMGYAGIGDGVEFCVAGFDRWMVYNGRCRVVR